MFAEASVEGSSKPPDATPASGAPDWSVGFSWDANALVEEGWLVGVGGFFFAGRWIELGGEWSGIRFGEWGGGFVAPELAELADGGGGVAGVVVVGVGEDGDAAAFDAVAEVDPW